MVGVEGKGKADSSTETIQLNPKKYADQLDVLAKKKHLTDGEK